MNLLAAIFFGICAYASATEVTEKGWPSVALAVLFTAAAVICLWLRAAHDL